MMCVTEGHNSVYTNMPSKKELRAKVEKLMQKVMQIKRKVSKMLKSISFPRIQYEGQIFFFQLYEFDNKTISL